MRQHLGQIAARERRLSGLTQDDVAELIPCDVSTVRRWEVGIRRLTIEMAAAYAETTGSVPLCDAVCAECAIAQARKRIQKEKALVG